MPGAAMALAALLLAAPAAAEPWRVDPSGSAVKFRNETFYGSVEGTLGSVTGVLDIDPASKRLNSLRIAVAANELATGNLLEDRILHSAVMLDTGAYPTITFEVGRMSSTIETGASVSGDLILRDARGPLTVSVMAIDAAADDVRVQIMGAFVRSTFGMTAFEGLSDDRVDLEIDLLLRRAVR